MENAIWKGKKILALDISRKYENEKEIRKASVGRELMCPDPNCKTKILKYCHGKERCAYFAHLNNVQCDYAEFDKTNIQVMRNLKKKLFELFSGLGFKVELEVKLLAHHYTHLLFSDKENKKLAVEINTHNLTVEKINRVKTQYDEIQLPVKWIVIDDIEKTVQENQTYFINRFALNETSNNDLLIVDPDCNRIVQYKLNKDNCDVSDNLLQFEDGFLYSEKGNLSDLILEKGNLTINGFYSRYDEWHKKRECEFYERKRLSEAQEQERKKREELFKQRSLAIKKDLTEIEIQELRKKGGKTIKELWSTSYSGMVILNIFSGQEMIINGSDGEMYTNDFGRIIGKYSNRSFNGQYRYSDYYPVKNANDPIWKLKRVFQEKRNLNAQDCFTTVDVNSFMKNFDTYQKVNGVEPNKNENIKELNNSTGYSNFMAVKKEDDLRKEILSRIDQQSEAVYDSTGVRWFRCEHCGKVAPEKYFYCYGGVNKMNIGTCKECLKNGKDK